MARPYSPASDDGRRGSGMPRPAEPSARPLGHQGQCWSVAFSPDGKTVLTGSQDKTARLWDVATGRPLGLPMKHQGGVDGRGLQPRRQDVLTGSDDKTARLWDAATGQPLGPPMEHQGRVLAVAFSPDGKTVLTGARTRRRGSGRRRLPAGLGRHCSIMRGLGRGVQPRRQVGAHRGPGQDGAALGRGHGPAHRDPDATSGRVSAVAFSPDGKTVLTGSWDKTARLWDAATGQPIGPPMHHQGGIRSRGLQPRRQDASLPGAMTRRRGCGTRRLAGPSATPSIKAGVHAVAFSPDGKTILTGSRTRRRGCGTRRLASPSAYRSNTRIMSWPWRSAPTARSVLTGALTTRPTLGRDDRPAHRPATAASRAGY